MCFKEQLFIAAIFHASVNIFLKAHRSSGSKSVLQSAKFLLSTSSFLPFAAKPSRPSEPPNLSMVSSGASAKRRTSQPTLAAVYFVNTRNENDLIKQNKRKEMKSLKLWVL